MRPTSSHLAALALLAAACGPATPSPEDPADDAPDVASSRDAASPVDDTAAPADDATAPPDDATASPDDTTAVAPDDSGTVSPPPTTWPCPAAGPCAILPLGDSITVGVGSDAGDGGLAGGYRSLLAARLVGDHRAFTWVGTRQDAFGRHEGHTGATICDALHGFVAVATSCPPTGTDGTIEQVLDSAQDASGRATVPDIVLLMLGANTVRAGNTEEPDPRARAQAELEQLLTRVHRHLPDALIVVAKITPNYNGTNDDAVRQFNAQVAGAVAGAVGSEGAEGSRHFAVVDMFSIFAATYQPAYTSPDRLHPANAGYQRIANVWFDAIAPRLRATP